MRDIVPALEREDGAVWVTGTDAGVKGPGVLLPARPHPGESATQCALRKLRERHGIEGREAIEEETPLEDGTRIVRVASWRGAPRNGRWWWPQRAEPKVSGAHARLIALHEREEEAVRALHAQEWREGSAVRIMLADHEDRIVICTTPWAEGERGWGLPEESAYPFETLGECVSRLATEQLAVGVLQAQILSKANAEHAKVRVVAIRRWEGTPQGCMGQRVAWIDAEKASRTLPELQGSAEHYRACQAR